VFHSYSSARLIFPHLLVQFFNTVNSNKWVVVVVVRVRQTVAKAMAVVAPAVVTE
jgi:general stress protein CsbA